MTDLNEAIRQVCEGKVISKTYIAVDDIYIITDDDGYRNEEAEFTVVAKRELGRPAFKRGEKVDIEDIQRSLGDDPRWSKLFK